jgi:hypothetical protein
MALRGEVGGCSPFNLTGRGISDYRRRVKVATAISTKGVNSRRHTMTMVRTSSIPPSSAGASNRAEGRGRILTRVLRRVEWTASGRAPWRWWSLRLGLGFGSKAALTGGGG